MNIKKNQIDELNVDDYIRQQKRLGQRKFFWSGKALEVLYSFVSAVAPCKHGWFCFCGEGVSEWIDKNFKSGIRFMGVNHYFK